MPQMRKARGGTAQLQGGKVMNGKTLLPIALLFEIISPILMNLGLFIDNQLVLSHKFVLTGVLWLTFGTLIWCTVAFYLDVAKTLVEESK